MGRRPRLPMDDRLSVAKTSLRAVDFHRQNDNGMLTGWAVAGRAGIADVRLTSDSAALSPDTRSGAGSERGLVRVVWGRLPSERADARSEA